MATSRDNRARSSLEPPRRAEGVSPEPAWPRWCEPYLILLSDASTQKKRRPKAAQVWEYWWWVGEESNLAPSWTAFTVRRDFAVVAVPFPYSGISTRSIVRLIEFCTLLWFEPVTPGMP